MLLQCDVQNLAAKLAHLDLQDAIEQGKQVTASTEKTMANAPVDFRISLVLNNILRSVSPPEKKSATPRGGGGKKKANAVKAAAAKVIEGEPPTGLDVRKALRSHAHLLAKEIKGHENGQVALLKALQSWLLSPQGATALSSAAKIIEVLYDKDCSEEAVLTSYWNQLLARRAREEAELVETEANLVKLTAEMEQAEAAEKKAMTEKENATWELKNAEYTVQATRCGSNPSHEEQCAEKAALASMKKTLESHNQATKIHSARSKNLVEKRAECEPCQRLVEELRQRKQVGIELFSQHAKPFFDWLATADESDDGDEPAELT